MQPSTTNVVPLESPVVKALRMTSVLEEIDASSDTDQEIFCTVERVYDIAEIGSSPEQIYRRLMGYCTNQENVSDLSICVAR